MNRIRRPKNLDQYTTTERAAMGLERLAQDLRQNHVEGDLIRWNINISRWNENWNKPVEGTRATEAP